MPAILITILTAFASSLVARLLLGAGLMFFTYNFADDLVAQAQQQMKGLFYSLPSDVLGLISILKIPQGLGVIMSAMGIAAFIKSAKVMLGKAA
ncbi:hypothetical protein J502_2959 [Acinetobacter sp. 1294596]|uniref:DUF2523 domain-containing protein n=1 Tax=Acinetobacter sp. 1294596 TaxID=1310603 RepID=UPI00044E234B|nr:DUF2523 domain-containing protein [Acinetobacter sp. 1294596]EXF55952.1 hypothetical protein J502_2959 [Acinetobacter sp. 1294596]